MEIEKAEALLKQCSLRVTRPRLAVLSAIESTPHSDAAAIVSAVREKIGTVSTQAVYDVLSTFVDTNLARRIAMPNGAARYELETGDHHHHIVCRDCGSIHDVDDPGIGTPLTAGAEHGFQIENVEVTYWGTCAACQTA